MDPVGGGGGRSGGMEARRLLEISVKLLDARDLVGSKRFAERALESDPLLDGVDQILAVVDVLLASQRRVNNHLDSYSILQLPHPSSAADDTLSIKRNYRRLALLLSPDRSSFHLADSALRFVVDAYAVLSDPAKKSLLDAELKMVDSHLQSNGSDADAAVGQPDRAFWTSCPSCCHVFEYDRSYLNRTLRCRTCRQPFHAGEMMEKPPVVPGTDMYYCAWGFFPLGFRGGPAFPNADSAAVPEFGEGWKPFQPMTPLWRTQREGQPEKPLNAVPVNVAAATAATAANQNENSLNKGMHGNLVPRKRGRPPKNKHAVSKRIVESFSRTKSYAGGAEPRNEGTEARGARGSESVAATGVGISHFDIDLDATDDVLGNLHNLHFLREEDIQIQLP